MPAAAARTSWSWRLVRRAAIVSTACLSAGAALGYAVSHERGPSSPSGPVPRARAGPAELAFVEPLRVGGTLEGYSIDGIEAVHDGTMGVVVGRAGETVRLEIAVADPGAPPPPGVAGRYAVYVDFHGSPPADGERLASALARIVGAHPSVPPPPGLAAFTPRAGP